MKRNIKAVAAAMMLGTAMWLSPAQAFAVPESANTSVSEVGKGSTSVYRTDSVLPSQEDVFVGEESANASGEESGKASPEIATSHKELQKQKEAQLKEQDSWGGAITILSMAIVIMALAILSVLFLCFGRISSLMQRRRKQEAHGPLATPDHEEEDSGEVIAAIAAALDEHFSGKHDMEDYILTIKSMKRSYSPWNSKIYNLRIQPQVKH